MDTFTCTCCKRAKPIDEFMGLGAKGATKQFRTCDNCRTRMAQKQQSTKKRQLEIDGNDEGHVEMIEANSLSEYVAQSLNAYTAQPSNSQTAAFTFQYQMDISAFDKPEKEVADQLIEFVEDVDEFAWMYVLSCYCYYCVCDLFCMLECNKFVQKLSPFVHRKA
jgi:hypothetical protein